MNGIWTAATVVGKSVDVYQPAGLQRARFAVLYLHDIDGETLRDKPAFTRWFDELKLPCVSPLGGQCWWVDRPCGGFDSGLTPERLVREAVMQVVNERLDCLGPGLSRDIRPGNAAR
jgi:S-formylglutathione hydrolase